MLFSFWSLLNNSRNSSFLLNLFYDSSSSSWWHWKNSFNKNLPFLVLCPCTCKGNRIGNLIGNCNDKVGQASRKPNTKKTKRFGGFGFRTEDCVFLVYCDLCGQKGKKTRDFLCLLKKLLLFKQCNKRQKKTRFFGVHVW